MNEVERVRNMLAEGKITADEAERLISVLEEVDDVERDLHEVGAAADRIAPEQGRTEISEVGTPTFSAAGDAAGGWPDVDRWVRISMFAGDLDVRLDESISEPVVRSADGETVEVQPDGNGYTISQFDRADGDLFKGILDGFRRSDLDVRLPPGFNLGLDIKAGDVTIRDIPYLRGSLLAGDLDAKGLQGVEFTMQAGDLDLELTPTSGQHRVRVSAGDVKVRLRQTSSVQVRGRVSIGEVRVSGGASSQRSGIGASLAATVGAGDAALDLQLSTGQLTLEVQDA